MKNLPHVLRIGDFTVSVIWNSRKVSRKGVIGVSLLLESTP